MRLRIYEIIVCVILCNLNYAKAQERNKTDYLPQTPCIAKNIDRFSLEVVSQSHLLAALSLQGIVNRDTARIYTHGNSDKWALDLYKSKGYIQEDTLYSNVFQLLEKYKKQIKGAVVYDPDKDYTVNLATNVAGVESRIIICPDMIDSFRISVNNDIKDLRDYRFENATSAFRWYKTNIYPHQEKNVLSVAKGLLYMYDVYRDYLVEFRIPVFWLPGEKDLDYDPEYEAEVIKFFEETPVNIPVLGFWPGVNEAGENIGYTEFDGVKLAGKYGKFTLVNTWVGNYSFHSGVKPRQSSYLQKAPANKSFRKYDPSKKYVALIMNESGDAPCYFLYTGFFPRQWNDPNRGEVAISYGITPSLRMLAPAILEHIYQTQSPNDYFFTSISGAGYCYPFEGYCENTRDKEANLNEYYSGITASNMKILDLNMLGIYTHSESKWSDADYSIADEHIATMPGLTSIISGMHRTTFEAHESHQMMKNNVSVHHTLTFWSKDNYPWDNPEFDKQAVDHIENEIKTYGSGSQFIQAMFYSWHHGPRRLMQLQQRLEPEGYEFITLNEFDYLWREANERGTTY